MAISSRVFTLFSLYNFFSCFFDNVSLRNTITQFSQTDRDLDGQQILRNYPKYLKIPNNEVILLNMLLFLNINTFKRVNICSVFGWDINIFSILQILALWILTIYFCPCFRNLFILLQLFHSRLMHRYKEGRRMQQNGEP